MPEETILSRIKSPADLKQLTYPEMTALCGEIPGLFNSDRLADRRPSVLQSGGGGADGGFA